MLDHAPGWLHPLTPSTHRQGRATLARMDPNVIAAVVAAIAAVAASVAAFISLPFARQAARAAREQTQLQTALAREQAQPYVWADIQPDEKQGTVLQAVLGNSGPTVATNIRVTIDPPLTDTGNRPDRVEVAQRRLADGIRSLAPGRRIEWFLGTGPDMLANDSAQLHTIRVTADGPHGPITPLEFEVDLTNWREARDAPDGSLHLVRNSIKDLTKEVTALHRTLMRDE
jgi:hypothetical protein